jgi:hypothetical protein
VAPKEKVAARAKVVNAIRTLDWDERVLCVRVNAWDTRWTYGDVIEVVGGAGERLDEVMLPKVRRASDVVALDLLLSQVEANAGLAIGHIGIEAQIETAEGLINLEEICAASPRLESIVFGPADFAASIGMPVTTIDETIHDAPSNPFSYVFAKILMAGRANGLHVIDGPFLKVRDLEALRRAASISASYGFDGKWGDDFQTQRFVGPLEDRENPRVNEVATHGVLLGVAHASVDLHRLARHPLRRATDVGLGHRSFHGAGAPTHLARDVEGELARALDDRGHGAELHAGQLVVDDRLGEDDAMAGVLQGRLVRGLHDSDGPRGGLDPTVLEAGHLEVEALAQTFLAADEVLVRHEPLSKLSS